MRRSGLGVALASLALLTLPAGASAKSLPAKAAAPPKVLVVTSTNDALTQAGINAINQAASAGDFTVDAPAPADVGALFTPAGLDAYRAVVFLNTGQASPLTDAQRAIYETYFKKGGGFVGIGSAIETDPNWAFLSGALGTRSSGRMTVQTGTVKVFDRVHDASKNLPEYWDRTDAFYNFTTNVRGFSHIPWSSTCAARSTGRLARATRPTATAAPRCARTTRRPRSPRRRTSTSRSAST